jgi:DNA invertase Pin-like site-specific DNA recombinase
MSDNNSRTNHVAIYARVSTSNHGQDVGLQLDELRQVARQRRWVIQGEYVDDGVSGSKDSRPALDQMMTAARSGKIDLVAVWRFDRFARSTQHLLVALDEFRQLGVDFVSVREAVDTSTATGKMVFTFLAAVAEFEKALIMERVKAGVARAQAAGKHCGRPRRELDLRAAHALLSQGQSERLVAEMLGVPRGTLRRRLAEHRAGSEASRSSNPKDPTN